jgi:hypothetical protein
MIHRKKAIIALDLGLNTGWAIFNHEGIMSGHENFDVARNIHRCYSFMHYAFWLAEMLDKFKITHLYYEEVVSHAGSRAAHVYGSFETTTELEACIRGIVPTGIGVTTIKKFATSNGHADKPMMIRAAQQHNPSITSDNEADAFHLLRYAMQNTE